MNHLPDYVNLLRPGRLAQTAATIFLMDLWICRPLLAAAGMDCALPWYTLLLMIVAAVLVRAGGYVINDYFDVKIDRINRPDRLVVTRVISREGAMHLFMGLTGVGVALGLLTAWLCRSMSLGICFVLVPGLLWFYSASYKRQLLIGNLTISAVEALAPLLVAMAYGIADFYAWTGGFALLIFLLTWIREIVGDIEDQVGDREMECHTLPVVYGTRTACIVQTMLSLMVMALMAYAVLCFLPFDHSWSALSTRYLVFGLLTPLIGEQVLVWTAKAPADFKTSRQLLDWIILMTSLYTYVIQYEITLR